MTHDEAIAALKTYVATEYDGDIYANFKLDLLMWDVRMSHPNNHRLPQMRETEPAVPVEIEIDLEELGL